MFEGSENSRHINATILSASYPQQADCFVRALWLELGQNALTCGSWQAYTPAAVRRIPKSTGNPNPRVLHPTIRQKEVLRLPFWVPSGILSLRSSDFVDYFRFAQATSSITNPRVLHPTIRQKEALRLPFWVPSGIRTHDIQNHNLTL